jgi:drug/metabolite transporter (DMT)-like permease
METQAWAVAATLVATVAAALAAFLLKRGAAETHLALHGFRVSGKVVAAVGLYAAASGLFLAALTGAQLSVLVPLSAVEYVWVALLARQRLGEPIGRAKLVGLACIIAGVVLVGLGS